MKSEIQKQVVNSAQLPWKPLVEAGREYPGVFVKSLRFDPKSGRSPAILLKFEAGASYPYHNHPGGEELFVLEGSCQVNEARLETGDYLYTPVNAKHSVQSELGCELLLSIPREVEIL